MSEDPNTTTQAAGMALEPITTAEGENAQAFELDAPQAHAIGYPEGDQVTPGPVLEEISTNPPPVPGLQVEKPAGSLWHRRDGWPLDSTAGALCWGGFVPMKREELEALNRAVNHARQYIESDRQEKREWKGWTLDEFDQAIEDLDAIRTPQPQALEVGPGALSVTFSFEAR